MGNEGIYGAIHRADMTDHFFIGQHVDGMAGTASMCRGIKSQHFITFLHKRCYITFKVDHRGFKAMQDQRFFFAFSAVVPPVSTDGFLVEVELKLFSFFEDQWQFLAVA